MNAPVQAIDEEQRYVVAGFLLALFAAIFFSIKAIFVKLAYRHGVDAVTLLTLRMLFALPFFMVVAAMEEQRAGMVRLDGRQMLSVIAMGLVGYYLASLFDFIGLQYVSAGLERLILFLFPTFTVLLSALALGRKIGRVEVQALLLSYAGIALAVQQELVLDGVDTVVGVLLIFGGTLAYALYLVGSGELIPKIGARRFMAWAMIISCLAVMVQFLLIRDIGSLQQPLPVYGYGLLIAVISTVLPAFMLAGAIHRIGASHTSIIGGVGPVATIVMATLFLGEQMNMLQISGSVLVIGGVLLLGLRGRR